MIRLNQKGVIHFIPLLILLAGIIAGVYLVQHPAIFKPKAYDTNPSQNPDNQYDNPPSLIATDNLGATKLLTESGNAANYLVEINQSDDEIVINFNPQELTEEEAKNRLNNTDPYYLKMLMWLLLDPFNAIDGPPIDARYALCDHLPPDLLDKLGAEPTILLGEEGGQLECSNDPPKREQLGIGNSHINFEYKKISATILVKMIETARLQRENKGLSENAKDFAFDMIPILGPTINAIRSPGSDPLQVSQTTLITTLADVIIGPVAGVLTVKAGKGVVGYLATRINTNYVAIHLKDGTISLFDNLALRRLRTLLNNSGRQVKVKLIGVPDLSPFSEIIQRRIQQTYIFLKEAFPDIKIEIFSTKGSSGVIYSNFDTPTILYKVYTRYEDLPGDPIERWISNVRYAKFEAQKLRLLSQEGAAPKLIDYVPPQLTDEETRLLSDSSFGSWAKEGEYFRYIEIVQTDRISNSPIVVMERVNIDPKGFTKLVSDPQRKQAEIDRIVEILERNDLFPADTELVVDQNGRLIFIDVGGILPHSSSHFAEFSIREEVERFVESGIRAGQ